MSRLPARRLLFVHAHPDDESITNGVTMARYVAEGAHVTVVTCTLGEQGEVIPPALAHLTGDDLGAHRIGELRAAMRALGVTHHRFLGGPGHHRDSGMAGDPANDDPRAFCRADTTAAAAPLVEVVRETRPQVVVTYDPQGGYGHPDHIQTHRVATRAVELAADPTHRPDLGAPHRVARVYWTCVGRSLLERQLARLRASAADHPFPAVATPADVPGVVDDARVAVAIEGTPGQAAAKAAAMAAHATQISVHGDFFALSNGLGQPVLVTEQFRPADGTPPPPGPLPADDLFAGLET